MIWKVMQKKLKFCERILEDEKEIKDLSVIINMRDSFARGNADDNP